MNHIFRLYIYKVNFIFCQVYKPFYLMTTWKFYFFHQKGLFKSFKLDYNLVNPVSKAQSLIDSHSNNLLKTKYKNVNYIKQSINCKKWEIFRIRTGNLKQSVKPIFFQLIKTDSCMTVSLWTWKSHMHHFKLLYFGRHCN